MKKIQLIVHMKICVYGYTHTVTIHVWQIWQSLSLVGLAQTLINLMRIHADFC